MVCLEKLYTIKENTLLRVSPLHQLYNEEVSGLKHQVQNLKADMLLGEKKFKVMKEDLEARLRNAQEEKRETASAFLELKEEINKLQHGGSMDALRESKNSLQYKFSEMQKSVGSMATYLNSLGSEDSQQDTLVRTDLLKTILGTFNKGFKSKARVASTQTDLSLSSHSQVIAQFGLNEYMLPEDRVLGFFRHPFMPFLLQKSEHMASKVRSDEMIDFFEQQLVSCKGE